MVPVASYVSRDQSLLNQFRNKSSSKYPERYSTVHEVGREILLARKSYFE